MKKLTVLIAMLLVVALAVPAFADSFADVPANHWAYEAVNELYAAGIVEGYPDGEYKGQRNLTRYEIAMIISRVLANIEEESAAMKADIETLKIEDMKEKGLNTKQAEDVTAICKALIEKNMPEEQKVEIPESLTDKQAQQVADLIEALTFEFKDELQSMGTDVDALAEKYEGLDARVAALESPRLTFSGEFNVDFEEIVVEPGSVGYIDPYTEDYDDDDNTWVDDADDDDVYEEGRAFENELAVNIHYDNSPLKADLTLLGSTDAFDNTYTDEGLFTIDDLYGEIYGPDFKAMIGEDQALTLKPYLFDGTVDEDDDDGDDADDDPLFPVNGVIVEAFGNTYVLSSTEATHYPEDEKTIVAGTESVNVKGLALNFGFGYYDPMGASKNGVFGVDTTFDAAGFAITPTLAVSDKEFSERYFTLNATGDLGPIATIFNYKNIEGFEAIAADVADSKGFDIEGSMTVAPVDLVLYYENYDGSSPFTEFTADVTDENAQDFAGFDVYGNAVYATYSDVTDATAQIFNLYGDKEMDPLTVSAGLEYNKTTQPFEDEYADTDVYEKADAFDKFVGVTYQVSPAVDVGAKYTFDVNNELAHLYTANYAQGIVTAGLEKYIDNPDDDDDTILTASITPDAYDLYSVLVTPYADFGYKIDASASENFTNYAVGVDAEKAMSEKATLTGKLEYADKEFDVDNAGIKVTKEIAFEYLLTEDVSATASYLNMDFTGDVADDYNVKKATAGVSVAF